MKTNLKFLKPMITHVPFDNCILGILQNYPKTYDWIYSNFINIYINKNTGADYFFPKFLWNICPFIDTYSIPYILIEKNFQLFTDFLESCLNENFYVYTLINKRYINKYATSNDSDHNPIITNINSEQKTVQINDFFQSGIYESYNCSYDEINMAFHALSHCEGYNIDDYLSNDTEIILIKYNASREYTFSHEYFRQNIKNYLNSKNLLQDLDNPFILENNFQDSYYWGIDCWNNIWKGSMIRRYFSLLLAHSQMWKYRYNYFIEQGYFKKSETIESTIHNLNSTAQTILNLYLKMLIKSNGNIIPESEKINELIDNCKLLEYKICNYF